MHRSSQQLRLYLCLALPNVLGLITAIANFTAIRDLSSSINKPPFTLPTFLLVLCWITGYLAIGYATFLIWDARAFSDDKLKAIGLCAGQLLLHSFWVTCFFQYHWYLFSLLLHIAYLGLTFGNMMLYRQVNKETSIPMISYFVFCAYFTYLNLIVIFIN